MSKGIPIAPAEGKLGILLVGMGAVSTTTIAGVMAVRKGIAANKPYLIDVDIAADINPAGAGVWELPGLGRSKPGIGVQFEPS